MKHIINIDTWERKDNYNFFRGFANSWIAITSEADCTEAFARAKERGHSFFLYYLYAITRAVNEIKELRYRWDKNGQVVYHDTVDVITPIAVPGRTFYTVRIPYHPDFDMFYREARRIITSIPEDGDPYGTDKQIAEQGDFDVFLEVIFHLHYLYPTISRASVGLSANECGQSHHPCRTALYADSPHDKPCLCRRSAHLAFLRESGTDVERTLSSCLMID